MPTTDTSANDESTAAAPRGPRPRACGQFLGASELAVVCGVDLKTIHNWINRGALACFRTPGRHVRFRPADVVRFLRGCGFEVPPALADAEPRPVVVIGSASACGLAVAALPDAASPPRHLDPYDALILARVEPAAAYVVEAAGLPPPMPLRAVLEALGRANPRATLVVLGGDPTRLPASVVRVERGARALRATLQVVVERAAALDER